MPLYHLMHSIVPDVGQSVIKLKFSLLYRQSFGIYNLLVRVGRIDDQIQLLVVL